MVAMIALSRTVRFCVTADGPGSAGGARVIHNGFAGWPPMHGLGAFYELIITCRGEPDPVTGYLLNIKAIDEAVRTHAISLIERAFRAQIAPAGATARMDGAEPHRLLKHVMAALQAPLGGRLHAITWRLTPYHALTMSTDAADRIVISQQFEFAAAHRLQSNHFTADQNREIFGKCNNAHGHGHNYRLEAAVSLALGGQTGGRSFDLAELERIVDETVVRRFDHKHLNLDTREFAQVNPSVEQIAKVCYDLLEGPIAAARGRLERVTVWETEKTSCTYPAAAMQPASR